MDKYKITISTWGTIRRRLNGIPHRVDGPAIEWVNGRKDWWLKGRRHREDGPALEWLDGRKEWWVDGSYVRGTTYG